MKRQLKKVRVALVMPNHADINSSLNNYVKTYQYLVKKGLIEVTLFTDWRNDLKLDGIRVEKIRGIDYGNVLGNVLFVLGIPRFYYGGLENKLKGFDVIVANNPEFYAYAYQAYRAAKKHNMRLVLRTSQTVEGFFLYKITKHVVNLIAKKAYRYASWNIFSNLEAEDRCLRLGLIENKKKSIITGHATDTSCFRPLKLKRPSYPVILSVGGLLKLKGHQYIMKALKRIHEIGFSDVELWVVGKGDYEDNLRTLAKDLDIDGNVKFLGVKGHNELASIYNTASVFVLANEQEITPAVNEALACELSVVAMDCGGISYVISKNTGLISKKYDIEDMAKKVSLILKNGSMAKKISKNGREKVVTEFSIEKIAGKMYRAFTQMP